MRSGLPREWGRGRSRCPHDHDVIVRSTNRRRSVACGAYESIVAIRKRGSSMDGFLQALRVQRWDDHRYYHHSRINQALHLVSALSFLSAYALIFTDPVAAALIGRASCRE